MLIKNVCEENQAKDYNTNIVIKCLTTHHSLGTTIRNYTTIIVIYRYICGLFERCNLISTNTMIIIIIHVGYL